MEKNKNQVNTDGIKEKLDRLERNRKKIAQLIIRDCDDVIGGGISEDKLEEFAESLYIKRVSFEVTEDGISALADLCCDDKYFPGCVAVDIAEDNAAEILGLSD